MARAIDQFLAAIRQAIYGKDVREAIASGIEQCYNDSTASAQKADIEAKGAEVLASIPDTYEDLQNDVDDLTSALTVVENKVSTPVDTSEFTWESGTYNATSGSPGATRNAIRLVDIPFAIKNSVVSLETDESGYSLRVIEMDSATETGSDHVLHYDNNVAESIIQNDAYLRIALLKNGIDTDTTKAQYVKLKLWSMENIADLYSKINALTAPEGTAWN